MGYISSKTIRQLVCEALHADPEFQGMFREALDEQSSVVIVDRSGEPPKKVLPPFVKSSY